LPKKVQESISWLRITDYENVIRLLQIQVS
jgi:hypothetical protein